MAKIRAPAGKEGAYSDYMAGMKYKDIAAKYGVSVNTVKSWHRRYLWDRSEQGGAYLQGANKTSLNGEDITGKNNAGRNPKELPIKQEKFCLYYLKTMNATQAAKSAGYSPESAHVQGCKLLKEPKVAARIKELKKEMTSELYIDAQDVLKQYAKIAFADMTDFIGYGTVQEEVITKNGQKKIIEKEVVRLTPSSLVDGQVIAEIKRGKNGMSIKLKDSVKALDRLAQWFDILPDEFQREIALRRLELREEELRLKREAEENKGW